MKPITIQARKAGVMSILSSPRLALAVLLFLALFIGTVSWLPWTLDPHAKAPGWASTSGLDRPFSSTMFLGAVLLLLMNTLACTIQRTATVWALLHGSIPERLKVKVCSEPAECASFLKSQGFRTKTGPPYFKNRFALSRGWLFHVGLVVLILGILVQQSFHDSGAFEIGEREMISLPDRGVVFNRNAGIFAPAEVPGVQIALEQFDPYLHQDGYAPDRASTLMIRTPEGEQRIVLDRAQGVNAGGVRIYQAIPFGLALNLDISGSGVHSLHLRPVSRNQSAGEFSDPAGKPVQLLVESERSADDPRGTGSLRIFLIRSGARSELSVNVPFTFGDRPATIVSVSRWSGFTYSRSPGVSLVFAGFFLLLAGTVVMLIPAGLAVSGRESMQGSFRIYLTQGSPDSETSRSA